MPDRHPWTFEPNVGADLRAPRALEYIAQYLDRINLSLDRIADALESGKANEPLRVELRGLVRAMNR